MGFTYDPEADAIDTAAINIRCLEGIELSELKRIPVDGRSF